MARRLRRQIMRSVRLSSRAKIAIAVLTLAGIGLAVLRPKDQVLYNPSDSLPAGFYVRSGDAIERGLIVSVRSLDVAPGYARARDFADAGDRFLKRVAALDGDEVCASGDVISINGAPVTTRFAVDDEGRALPSWNGCVTLKPGDVFLLGDHPASFDGRYWGVTKRADLDGPWKKLR
jgi:conjugative transfer signal peptidase TraF